MNFKRIIGTTTAFLAAAALLVAVPAPAAAQEVELNVLSWMGNAHRDYYAGALAEFEQRHGVKVNLQTTSTSAYFDRLQSLIAAGSPPDIIFLTVTDLARFADSGLLRPLDDLIARDNYDIDDFFPASTEQYRRRGSLWGIPYDFGNRIVLYNVGAFNEAGLAEPEKRWDSPGWTNEDLLQVSQRLIRHAPDGSVQRWAFTFPTSDRGMAPILYSFGARYISEKESAYVTGLAGPEAIDAFTFIQELVAVRGLARASGGYADVVSGAAAMSQAIPGNVVPLQAVDFEWDIAPWPRGPAGRFTSGGGTAWFLMSSSKHPELAWELLKFLTSEKVQLGHMQNGNKAPGRRSVAFHPDFIEMSPPKSMSVFIEAWQNIVNEPSVTTWSQYWNVVVENLRALTSGALSPVQAAERIAQMGNPVLREAGPPVD